jgi:hypothetical protein
LGDAVDESVHEEVHLDLLHKKGRAVELEHHDEVEDAHGDEVSAHGGVAEEVENGEIIVVLVFILVIFVLLLQFVDLFQREAVVSNAVKFSDAQEGVEGLGRGVAFD